MRRIGLVVNPIAGMGGRVGLKGTDGKVDEAVARGAEMRAPDRAREALEGLKDASDGVAVFTYGDGMGETVTREVGLDPVVVGTPDSTAPETDAEDADESLPATGAGDTRDAVRAFLDREIDLVLFVGGDGTAVDVAETLSEAGATTPILGVPAGVKVYSSVFAVRPRTAGHIAATFEDTEQAEVNDIDEDEYRTGEVRTELRAIARVPVDENRQESKQLAGGTTEGLAERFAADIRSNVTYVLGPGSTIGAIKEQLGFDGTALGVDVYRDGEVLAADAAESDILDALGEENVIVVSPIGGQGFVFGRGNDQISPAVIRNSEVEIVASRRKLDETGVLRVDTGDAKLDERLRGWHRVRVSGYERRLVELV
jgi:NAD+ kinase